MGQSNKILKQHIGKAGTQAAVQKEEKYSWRKRFNKNWGLQACLKRKQNPIPISCCGELVDLESSSGEWPGVLVSGNSCSMGGKCAKRITRPGGTQNDYCKQRVCIF